MSRPILLCPRAGTGLVPRADPCRQPDHDRLEAFNSAHTVHEAGTVQKE